jgi:L-threonylcarbamoyladenylate synthase
MRINAEQAISLLKAGLIVALPTETVYGLAASIDFPRAIQEIFKLKGRPENNPLIVHIGSTNDITLYAKDLPPSFDDLAKTFWPGPLTLIIPVKEDTIPAIARAGLPTAGFRIPNHKQTIEVLNAAGPLVMPSANLSGKPSATSAKHVEDDFGSGFSVLDGGDCEKGVESTILFWDQSKWIVVRLGVLAPEAFCEILGYEPQIEDKPSGKEEHPICPGQLYRHYSPKAKLILANKIPQDASSAIIGFSDRNYPKSCPLFSIGDSSNPNTAAHALYAVLRQLDIEYVESALVDMDFPNRGLWMTLRERLQKAAAPY